MTVDNKEINQLIIGGVINLLLVGYLIKTVWAGNDKAIILLIFFYPMIIAANGLAWITLRSRAFKWLTIVLLMLMLPVLLLGTR